MHKYKIIIRKVKDGIWAPRIKAPSTWSSNTASSTDYGATSLNNCSSKEEAEKTAINYLEKLKIMDYEIIYE